MRYKKVLVVIVVIFIFLLYVVKNRMWTTGKESYHTTKNLLGKPTYIHEGLNEDGYAMWKSSDPFEEVIVTEKGVPHAIPEPHEQSVVACVSIPINNPMDLIYILSISKSFWYNQNEQKLYVRAKDLVTATRLLDYAISFIREKGDTKRDMYQKNELKTKFVDIYNTSNPNDKGMFTESRNSLSQNISSFQKTTLPDGETLFDYSKIKEYF